MAMNVHDAAMQMVEGGCDLLMCYHHPRQPVQLDPARYDMLLLGTEAIYPYSPCDNKGQPLYRLPGKPTMPLPFLAYGRNAFFGRMVELILNEAGTPLYLDTVYETDMSEGLKVMALEGHGLAFLPESAVPRELRAGQLARADVQDSTASAQRRDSQRNSAFSVTMDVRLYRERTDPRKPVKRAVERLWQYMAEQRANPVVSSEKAPRQSRGKKKG
jgi:DNA-binding transcriptional LysR family regulator